jgi:hypothetical protein
MDGYGRLLCFLNVNEPDRARRPEDYNLRALRAGLALPYFIWPNIDPFLRTGSVTGAAGAPRPLRQAIADSRSLRIAREAVRAVRTAGGGLYGGENPLRLMPFELRFLARRSPPDRWVIDLSADDDRLHPPQGYIRIPNPEDRLFLPTEYVALFVENGWRRA